MIMTKKTAAILVCVLFAVLMLPIIITCFYTYPVLDDYNFSVHSHWAVLDGENVLIESLVKALEHGVVLGVLVCHGEVLLDAHDAFDGHVLGDFHGIGAPGGHHLAAWADEVAFERLALDGRSLAVEPTKFSGLFLRQRMLALRSDDAVLQRLEKTNSHIWFLCDLFCVNVKC